jgi:hypothetical protein
MLGSIWFATLVACAVIPATGAVTASQQGATAAKAKPVKPRPDLADVAAGTYLGAVASDARGSSREDVTITITKTGPNTVRIDSSYPRLPSVTTRLQRVMETVQNVNGAGKIDVFLLELNQSPPKLSLTIDDASWYGEKQR